MRTPRSLYNLTEHGEFLCLVDSGQGRSITNDAEAVIAELAAAGHDLSRKRVLYRDTMGYWDELVVKDGRFSHFGPIHETDLSRALIKARRAVPADAPPLPADTFFAAPAAQTHNADIAKDTSQHEHADRGR